MSKISRIGQNECYNVTADWLKDFAKKYAKSSGQAPPAPPNVFASTEKFATIEEKMKDIMNRVGFTNIHNIKEGGEAKNNSKVAKKNCSCGKTSTGGSMCQCEAKEEIGKIISYVKEVVRNEPNLPSLAVIGRCKSEDGLKFDYLIDNLIMNRDKLLKFIKELKEKNPIKKNEVKYYKQDLPHNNQEDDVAEYWGHGIPSKK